MTETSATPVEFSKPGVLALIVGQSGVGKDTLLNGARSHFINNSDVVFVERTITRAREPTEQHRPSTPERFARLQESSAFAFFWEAHGLSYGVPISIESDLAAGRLVVCNASRTVIAFARAHYSGTAVIEIVAGRGERFQRLSARGRENASEIQQRVDRHVLRSGADAADIVVENNGSPEMGIQTFIGVLQSIAPKIKR